jgi:hypothetical protein
MSDVQRDTLDPPNCRLWWAQPALHALLESQAAKNKTKQKSNVISVDHLE